MDDRLKPPHASDIQKVLKFDTQALPSFVPVMAKLLVICNDDRADMDDVARLVETDPGISTKVLGIVNSAFAGLTRRISAVSDAVLYLGIEPVKKICLGVTVFEKMIQPGAKNQFNRTFFWRHCLCVASLSHTLAAEIGYPNPEEAYTAGLLHDFGKIILNRASRVNYGHFIDGAAACAGQLVDGERDIIGMGHDDLGAYYSQSWHLPESLGLVIKFHHRQFEGLNLSRGENELIAIVSLANFLAWTQGMGSVDILLPPVLQPEVERVICLEHIDFEKVVRQMDKDIERTSRFYRFVFPSSSQFRANLLQANLKLSSINSIQYFLEKTEAWHGKTRPMTASLTAPHHSLDSKKIISATLKAICDDFGFDRIYILKMVKPVRSLQVMECLDQGRRSDSLSSARIPMDRQAGGFIQCLRKREPVLITGTTPGEKKVLEKFAVHQMLIVPFCSGNRVIGILGMDHAGTGRELKSDLFASISIVANELGLALENASAYTQARSISLHDGLTGLLNRLAMDTCLGKAFRKAVDGEMALSLAMIDIDYFKKFNDQFGHQAGDNVLKLIAKTLMKMSRPSDHVGRYGGEEFIVVLNDTDLAKAVVYAQRIRNEIERLGNLLLDRFPGLPLTVSLGVSQYETGINHQDALVSRADKALYKAKASGRNRVRTG